MQEICIFFLHLCFPLYYYKFNADTFRYVPHVWVRSTARTNKTEMKYENILVETMKKKLIVKMKIQEIQEKKKTIINSGIQ